MAASDGDAVVRITADTSSFQAGLQAAQGQARTFASGLSRGMGPANSAMNETLRTASKFKEGLGRARETAMFFTSSLQEFGPAGRTAQMALSGIAGAMLGGGGVLLALEAVRVAVRLLVDAWQEEKKAAEEAAKKRQEAVDAEHRAAVKGLERMNVMRDQAKRRLADLKDPTEAGKLARDLASARLEVAVMPEGPHKKAAQLRLQEIAQLNDLIVAEEKLKKVREAAAESRSKPSVNPLLNTAVAGYAGPAELVKPAEPNTGSGMVQVGSMLAKGNESFSQGYLKQAAVDAKAFADAQDLARKKSLELQSAATGIAQSFGSAFANVIGGTQTAGQAFAAMGQQVIGVIMDMVTKQILANAAGAASGAASSQSAIPIVGPALAVAAMSMMLGTVQGLLGKLPSAAGGWTIPVGLNPLVQAHGGEHIIPREIAQRYERGAPGGGGGTTINVNGNLDGVGVYRTLTRRDSDLRRSLDRLDRRRR